MFRNNLQTQDNCRFLSGLFSVDLWAFFFISPSDKAEGKREERCFKVYPFALPN